MLYERRIKLIGELGEIKKKLGEVNNNNKILDEGIKEKYQPTEGKKLGSIKEEILIE